MEISPGNKVPYSLGLEQHVGQKDIHFSPWKFYVAMWGRRTGKTISAAAEAFTELCKRGGRTWIVAPNYELTDRVFEYLYKWVVHDKLLDEIMGPGSVIKASKTKDLRLIETAWGSFVRGKSAEAPDSLIGDQLDLVIYDECARCPEKIFTELLQPTLTDRDGRVLFISTPRGKNWFYQYFQRRLDGGMKKNGWFGKQMSTVQNPFISEEEVEKRRAETPPDIFRREYEASPEQFTGMIYPMYKDSYVENGGHLYDPTKLTLPEGTDYIGIDIGWRHPTAAVWGRVDREGNLWIHREYLGEPGTAHIDHAKNIATLCSDVDLYNAWISPDAKRKHPVSKRAEDSTSPLDVYRGAGIYVRPALDDVDIGVEAVRAYLLSTPLASSEHPSIFISEHCTGLRQAIPEYVFDDNATRKERDLPEKPRKYKDDLVDAFRYLIATRPRYVPPMIRRKDDPYATDVRYGIPTQKSLKQRKQAYPGAPVLGWE